LETVAATLRRTPLHQVHRDNQAKMVPFGGWDMPVEYSGLIAEHQAVRTAAGLFDVSHMGEFEVEGPGALGFLQRVTANDVAKLAVGQAQYSALPMPSGAPVDDPFAPVRFAVALFDVGESTIAPGSAARIETLGTVGQAPVDDGSPRPTSRDELWTPLVLIVLAVLCVEWMLYHRDGVIRIRRALTSRLGRAPGART